MRDGDFGRERHRSHCYGPQAKDPAYCTPGVGTVDQRGAPWEPKSMSNSVAVLETLPHHCATHSLPRANFIMGGVNNC